MTDRPILFSAPMVNALLGGRKTQTRRLAWSYREAVGADDTEGLIRRPSLWHRVRPGDRLWVREAWGFQRACEPPYCLETDLPNVMRPGGGWTKPYHRATTENGAWGMYGPPKWHSAMYMPRSASRLTLTVTDARVQRLQEITEADAQAEGVAQFENGRWHYEPNPEPAYARLTGPSARDAFHDLWDTIHGAGAWDANPHVVALTFTVDQRNIDA